MTIAFKSPVTSANVNAKLISRTDDQDASGNINFVNGIKVDSIQLSKASAVLDFGGTDGIKLPNGTTAQRPSAGNGVLRYNETSNKFEGYENGSWTNVISSAGTISIVSKTTNYTSTDSDEIIYVDGTSGAFAITLHTPSANQRLTIKRIDSTMANVIDITGTVDGATNKKLHTIGETYELAYSTSLASWRQVAHYAQTAWIDGGTITITAETSNPTKGTTGIDKFWWRRVGSDVFLKYQYAQTALGSAAAGTGNYIFALPITVDTTVIPAVGAAIDADMVATTDMKSIIGKTFCSNNGSRGQGLAVLRTSTSFCLTSSVENSAGQGVISSTNYGLNNANSAYQVEIGPIPVSGWIP